MSLRNTAYALFILVFFLLTGLLLQGPIPTLPGIKSFASVNGKTLELSVTQPDDPLEFDTEGLLTLRVTNTGDETPTTVYFKLPNIRSIYYTGDIAEPEDVITRATAVFGDIAPYETVTLTDAYVIF